MPCCDGRPPVPIVVSVAAGSSGNEPAAPSIVPEPSSSNEDRNGQSFRIGFELGRADALPTRRAGPDEAGRRRRRPEPPCPNAPPGSARSNPRASLTVGAMRSSVVPSGTLASGGHTRRRRTRSAPAGRWRLRRPATAFEHRRRPVTTGVPSATARTSGERPSRNPFTTPSFTASGSGQNGTRTASPPDASHERPAQVAVSTAAGIPIAARTTSIRTRRRPVTRQPRYRARSHWVVVLGGVVFRRRADALPTCVRRARRAVRRGDGVLGRRGQALRGVPNPGNDDHRAHGQHRARARRAAAGVGREPRVGRLLDAARMAPADLARQQRGPQRRDPDPADRAELRGFGPPARRAVGLRAGRPDVLVRPRATSPRPARSNAP